MPTKSEREAIEAEQARVARNPSPPKLNRDQFNNLDAWQKDAYVFDAPTGDYLLKPATGKGKAGETDEQRAAREKREKNESPAQRAARERGETHTGQASQAEIDQSRAGRETRRPQ